MPDLTDIYNHHAEQYQKMVEYEDYPGNLLRAIQAITPLEGLDVIETGAGTGRVTCLLSPYVHSLHAFDLSAHMLSVTRSRLAQLGYQHVQPVVADHRSLPVAPASADLIISGWSLCYVYLDSGPDWRSVLDCTLADFRRFLRPGGKIILSGTLVIPILIWILQLPVVPEQWLANLITKKRSRRIGKCGRKSLLC